MTSKIVATVRTLNEERNIAHFCAAYAWADAVLVADGGSEDRTVEIAGYFPHVLVRAFEERVETSDGSFMNPEPRHVNFLINWALEEEADWIIFDDADCWPNPALNRKARAILEGTDKPMVYLHRLYLWGQDEYFPKYNICTALWAWQPNEVDVFWEEKGLTNFESQVRGVDPERALHLEAPPYCCLHYFAPDEVEVQRKMARYEAWVYPQVHPLQSIYAPPEPLPEWVWSG